MEELLAVLGVEAGAFHRSVEEDLAKITGGKAQKHTIVPLQRGASIRGYARVHLEGADPSSLVVMIMKDPDPAKGVEEVMESGAVKELPFVNVQKHLEACGTPVPKIYHYNEERGLLYLEDCGDLHLRWAAEDGEEEKQRWFGAAVDELVKIQVDGTGRESKDFIGFMARFDRRLLRWELDHFMEYAVKNRMDGKLEPPHQDTINRSFDSMVQELRSSPYALQHRDYHMDNLLIHDGRIRVIDFQDALMGPLPYDLACFLYDRDTGALLGKELIERLVERYMDGYEERGGVLDRGAFRRTLDLCVLHRMLKVVGRFHFIDQVKKRPEYLRFIPFMLPVIREHLEKDGQRKALLDVLSICLPEL